MLVLRSQVQCSLDRSAFPVGVHPLVKRSSPSFIESNNFTSYILMVSDLLRIEGLDEENDGQDTQKTEREVPTVSEQQIRQSFYD